MAEFSLNEFLPFIYAIIGAVIFIYLFLRLIFMRDPDRVIAEGNHILSPADGRINYITGVEGKEVKIRKGLFGIVRILCKDVADRCIAVSISLSPLDVHIQRSPVDGSLVYSRRTKGSFRPTDKEEMQLRNEKNEMLIKGNGRYPNAKVVQIAGFIARRTRSFIIQGETLKKGQRIGRIVFGSQVVLIIPANMELKVKYGQRVKAGQTVIADV